MIILDDIEKAKAAVAAMKAEGHTVGLVPTMGYLHEGHLSLIRMAKAECSAVVVSIFVNPTQFAPSEDYAAYPRDMESDVAKCASEGVDAIFAPDAATMYPEGFSTHIDVGRIAFVVEGAHRPGHFSGVATVVAKLFNILAPGKAYFGQKDFQQTLVVKKLAADLNMPVEVVVGPTVREPDGLAMSSRNKYLSQEERAAAAMIYRALASARSLREAGETRPDALAERARHSLAEEPLVRVEYVEVVDMQGDKVSRVSGPAAIAVAARVGHTRLIDNLVI